MFKFINLIIFNSYSNISTNELELSLCNVNLKSNQIKTLIDDADKNDLGTIYLTVRINPKTSEEYRYVRIIHI